MATCRECIHQELCDTYSRMGVTDVSADNITICELFKNKSDYVKRERGEWRKQQFVGRTGFFNVKDFTCNNCCEDFAVETGKQLMNFCPNCGADMRKEQI